VHLNFSRVVRWTHRKVDYKVNLVKKWDMIKNSHRLSQHNVMVEKECRE
jgi:hypothetical protein